MFDLWAYPHQVRIDFSRPAKPTDNCFIESFNGSLRDECLNVHWFESMEEATERIEAWRIDYNESRPHQALREETPAEFALRIKQLEQSRSEKNRRRLILEMVRETQAAQRPSVT